MQRAVSGIGTRSSTGAIRRAHMCAECGKSFRNGEDLFMHAEICMLDAFEMEASAMHASDIDRNAPNRSGQRIDYHHQKPTSGISTQEVYISTDTYGDGRKAVGMPGRPVKMESKGPRTLTSEGEIIHRVGKSGEEGLIVEDDYEDDDSDYEPPPQLEPAELPKKNKRVFPIGEDGKQIRPKMECPTCGLVLYRHNFSTHFRIHTGELPFQCSFCDKRFRTSSALTVHTRCHTGERPYECPHCNYCCITKRNLDRHVANNHLKRSARAAALSRGGDYYYRGGGVYDTSQYENFDYDDAVEDIEDENLEEAELEEEAGISKLPESQHQLYPSNTGRYGNTESPPAPPSVPAAVVTEEIVASEEGDKSSYEPAYKRFASGPKTVPILDGPKGVYGEPDAEADGAGEKRSDPDKEKPSEPPEKESEPQDRSEGEKTTDQST